MAETGAADARGSESWTVNEIEGTLSAFPNQRPNSGAALSEKTKPLLELGSGS
jgi:hypothetical protein